MELNKYVDHFTRTDIIKLIKRYNERHDSKNKIKIGTKSSMYQAFLRGGNCTGIMCSNKNKLLGDYPIVKTEKNVLKKGGWLSSLDINNVMSFYQNKYQDFYFLGALPIDFYKIYPEIYNINLLKSSKIKKYGMVFNTDPSNRSGSHWFSVYIDINEKSICVFDSNGDYPTSEIKHFIDHINKKNDFKVFINTNEQQKTDGTCGLFALNFIIQRLIKNKSCNFLNTTKTTTDIKMEKLRKRIFR